MLPFEFVIFPKFLLHSIDLVFCAVIQRFQQKRKRKQKWIIMIDKQQWNDELNQAIGCDLQNYYFFFACNLLVLILVCSSNNLCKVSAEIETILWWNQFFIVNCVGIAYSICALNISKIAMDSHDTKPHTMSMIVFRLKFERDELMRKINKYVYTLNAVVFFYWK